MKAKSGKTKTMTNKAMKKAKGGAAAELDAMRKTAASDPLRLNATANNLSVTANASPELTASLARGKR